SRKCPLWPETVQAIQEALQKRPQPKNEADAGLVFITRYGKSGAKETCANPVSKETAKPRADLDLARTGRTFYSLRHPHRRAADEAGGEGGGDHIMGHESAHMSSTYRERISDERLRAVVAVVHRWLFPPKVKGKSKKG